MGQSIFQNGEEKFRVQAGSPVDLFVNGVFSMHTEFLVTDDYGTEFLRQYVSIGWLSGDGWINGWNVPNVPGIYWFYPDSADRSQYVRFEVVGATQPGTGTGGGGAGDTNPPSYPPIGGGGDTEPNQGGGLPSWLLPVGIGLAVLILLLPSDSKKKISSSLLGNSKGSK
jgi:hypothetical protein